MKTMVRKRIIARPKNTCGGKNKKLKTGNKQLEPILWQNKLDKEGVQHNNGCTKEKSEPKGCFQYYFGK